jgi:nitrogen regulatory protein PII
MSDNQRCLLTIVTESALENTVLKTLSSFGAKGYTISDARGKGSRGVRNAGWDASANIRVEVLGETAMIEDIAQHLQNNYYENYAMILFMQDVNVLRPDKFSGRSGRND